MAVLAQKFVERHAQARRFVDLDVQSQKAAAVALEFVYPAALRHGIVHPVVGIGHAARQQAFFGLYGELDGLARLPVGFLGPVVERGADDVMFREGALDAETRHVGLALPQFVGREFAARGGDALAVDFHFGLQERRLVEQVIARLVVARHFQGHHVASPVQVGLQVVAVDTVEAVRRDTGAVPHELSVHAQAVIGRGGDADQRAFRAARLDHLAERKREILFRLASLGPHGPCP